MLLEAGDAGGAPYHAVRNDGTPIDPGLRLRLFDKHVQGAHEQGARTGYGLGLYFSRLAVEAHGGRIAVEEHPGWATSFVARLPARGESTRAA